MQADDRPIDPSNCVEFMNYVHRQQHIQGHPHHHPSEHYQPPDLSCRVLAMIAIDGVVFLSELIAGHITHSLSLQSEAWHMISDEASLVVGLAAHRMSKRPPTSVMTFGWSRLEVIGGLLNASFLIAVRLMIFLQALERLMSPPAIAEQTLFMAVAVVGVVANILGLILFRDDQDSSNIRGMFLHVLSDFFGSLAVIASACINLFTKLAWKNYVDPALAAFVVVIMARSSYLLCKETCVVVAERCPERICTEVVEGELLKIDGVLAVHDLHIWELSKSHYVAMFHLVIRSRDQGRRILEAAHNRMIGFCVYSTTIQVEAADDFPHGIEHTRHCFYASSFGSDTRVFSAVPVYRHAIGCPHVNIEGYEDEISLSEEDPLIESPPEAGLLGQPRRESPRPRGLDRKPLLSATDVDEP
jgi:cation diffusion facilitator family transporter